MEGCFCFIFSLHVYLVVSLICVEKAFESKAFKRLDFFINLRKRITILWTDIIQIWIIYAHLPRPIGFLYHDRVCYPCWEHYLPEYANIHQVIHFCVNSLIAICRLFSLLLLHRVTPRCDVEAMFYDLLVNSCQIRWLPGKDGGVLPQERHQPCLSFDC